MVRLHIKPVIGRVLLDELGSANVRRLLATLCAKQTTGHGGGPRKLSPRMVQFGHAVLRNALSNAVREELVSRNVAKLVRMSSVDCEVGAGLDPIAARALLAQIADDRLFALYLCAIVLGMRRGELLGLMWDGGSRRRSAVGAAGFDLGTGPRRGPAAQDPGVPSGDRAAGCCGRRAA